MSESLSITVKVPAKTGLGSSLRTAAYDALLDDDPTSNGIEEAKSTVERDSLLNYLEYDHGRSRCTCTGTQGCRPGALTVYGKHLFDSMRDAIKSTGASTVLQASALSGLSAYIMSEDNRDTLTDLHGEESKIYMTYGSNDRTEKPKWTGYSLTVRTVDDDCTDAVTAESDSTFKVRSKL